MNSSKSWDLQIDSSVFKILQKIPRGNAENILEVIKLCRPTHISETYKNERGGGHMAETHWFLSHFLQN